MYSMYSIYFQYKVFYAILKRMSGYQHKGIHIFADYSGLIGNEYYIGEFVYNIMQESIETKSNMKIVHKNLVVLNEETQGRYTPPGFTAILQLDSSHFSAHSYTEDKEMGLLCIDIFTCMSPDTQDVLDYFETKLFERFPSVEKVSRQIHRRFLYKNKGE